MRVLTWDGCANVRDLGDLPTSTEARTRYGAIVRADDVSKLTALGRDEAARHGVRTVIDLRFPIEWAVHDDDRFVYINLSLIDPDGADTQAIRASVLADRTYKMIIDACGKRFVAVLDAIVHATAGGVVIHCAAGRDRTGLATAMILAVAGVDDDHIASDYAMSVATPPEPMHTLLSYVRTTFGGIEAYLEHHGATKQLLADFRARIVE